MSLIVGLEIVFRMGNVAFQIGRQQKVFGYTAVFPVKFAVSVVHCKGKICVARVAVSVGKLHVENYRGKGFVNFLVLPDFKAYGVIRSAPNQTLP